MLNIQDCILLIIDVQEKLIKATKTGEETSNNTAIMAKAAKILQIPTIITEQYPKGLGKTDDKILKNLNENEITFEKSSFSILLESQIKNYLTKLNRKQIVIGGIETHICVLQSAYDLIKNGYEVHVLKDCCSSRKDIDHQTGLELLKQYGAKITTTEITLFQWLKTSKHPNFKGIQELIK